MKAFAVIGFILLGFVVWWPAGVAMLLCGIWMLGKPKDKGPAPQELVHVTTNVAAKTLEVAEDLSKENVSLRHELNLRDVERVHDEIKEKIESALLSEGSSRPGVPAFHTWDALSDLSHEAAMEAINADPVDRASILGLLLYIDKNCQRIVELVCKDERWSLYRNRDLDFKDLTEMQGLASVAVPQLIRLATSGSGILARE